MFSKVCVFVNATKVSSDKAVLNSASVPEIVLSVKSIVLFVSVSVESASTIVPEALGKLIVLSASLFDFFEIRSRYL